MKVDEHIFSADFYSILIGRGHGSGINISLQLRDHLQIIIKNFKFSLTCLKS